MDELRHDEPRSPVVRQYPWLSPTAISLPSDAGFKPHEHWAWARIIRGEIADMRFFPQDDPVAQLRGTAAKDDGAGNDPRASDNWPAHREISANFMLAALFYEPWATARARASIRIGAAKFIDVLDWQNETYSGLLGLYSCSFRKRLNWIGLRVNGTLGMNASCLEAELGADGMVVTGDLFLRNQFTARGNVRLLGVNVGGDVAFTGAEFMNGFNADGIVVGSGLFCTDDFKSHAELRLNGARIAGNMDFEGAHLERVLNADACVVSGDVFCRGLRKAEALNFRGARIAQDLQLSQSVIDGVVDLTGAQIDGEINLAQHADDGPKWGPSARLVLRNASAGALAGGLHALKRQRSGFVPCELGGFSYQRLGGLGAGRAGSTLASASSVDLRAWLRRCRPSDHYDPAPYQMLAKALQDAGRKDRASDIRMSQGNYELVVRGTPPQQRFMLLMSSLFIGYGERNHRALLWFALTVIGAAAIGYWQDMRWSPAGEPDGWMDWQAWRDWVGYAFGGAVPLLTFDEGHKTFLVDRFCGVRLGEVCPTGVPTGLTGFFYTVKVIGFVILSYLAAGVSGLAQRRG